jgi:predicted DNA-binding transcriptional regulator YafY
MRIRYLHEGADSPDERELLPHKVWSRWGHWCLTARDVRETEIKQFRIDRMVEAEIGDTVFSPPAEVELPEWFDLAHHERTVRVRMRADALESLPSPHTLGDQTDLGDGRVELDITVVGDHRLDHLLVCLDATDEVVAPPEYAERRQARAAELLQAYGR